MKWIILKNLKKKISDKIKDKIDDIKYERQYKKNIHDPKYIGKKVVPPEVHKRLRDATKISMDKLERMCSDK